MVCTLFDYDTYMMIHDESLIRESIERGVLRGREEGREDERAAIIANMKALGLDDDTISKCIGVRNGV